MTDYSEMREKIEGLYKRLEDAVYKGEHRRADELRKIIDELTESLEYRKTTPPPDYL